jgi:hypothetical protein
VTAVVREAPPTLSVFVQVPMAPEVVQLETDVVPDGQVAPSLLAPSPEAEMALHSWPVPAGVAQVRLALELHPMAHIPAASTQRTETMPNFFMFYLLVAMDGHGGPDGTAASSALEPRSRKNGRSAPHTGPLGEP